MKSRSMILFSLLFMISFASATFEQVGMWHDANDIGVTIGGYTMSLQEAQTNNYIAGPDLPTTNGALKTYAHDTNDFLIIIDGFTMTVQEAIRINAFTFGATKNRNTTAYHTSEDISIFTSDGIFPFQEAINNENIMCQARTCADIGYECGNQDDSCNGFVDCGGCIDSYCSGGRCIGECTPGSIGTRNCDKFDTICRNYNDVSSTCNDAGYWETPCTSFTPATRGTSCEISGSACDGSGNCIGYSGSGCTNCPWGTTGKLCGLSNCEECHTAVCVIEGGGNWEITQIDYTNYYYSLISGVCSGSNPVPGPGYFVCAELDCTNQNSYGNCKSYSTPALSWSIKPKA